MTPPRSEAARREGSDEALRVEPLSRRRFLAFGAAAAASLLVPEVASAARRPMRLQARTLSFEHLHTGERLRVTYFDGRQYEPDALRAIDHVLRDHYSGDTTTMDRALMDLLHELGRDLGSNGTVQVISGYRSPATNQRLATQGHGVASRSLHMEGQAIDLRVPGRRLRDVRRVALALGRGGVGYYPRSNFVHVDTGRVRWW